MLITTRRERKWYATSPQVPGSLPGRSYQLLSYEHWLITRGDKLSFDPDCYCGERVPVDKDGMCTGPNALQNKLGEWNEWYVDIHSKNCKKHIQKVMKKRIKAAAKKGCDGVDPDNVDEVCLRVSGWLCVATLTDMTVLEPSDLQYHRARPSRLPIVVV